MTAKPPHSDPSKAPRPSSIDPIGATIAGVGPVDSIPATPASFALGDTAVGGVIPSAPKPFRGPSSLKATMVSSPVKTGESLEIAATAVPSMQTPAIAGPIAGTMVAGAPALAGSSSPSGASVPEVSATSSLVITGSEIAAQRTTGSGAVSLRGPMSMSLPANTPMDVTLADVTAVSVLPSIQMYATHAEISSQSRPRYARVKALGEGGVGAVDLVYDNDIARRVALKRLKNDTRTPANLARFIEEIQAVGSLEHPGIAPIHDVGLDESGYFFTMKFVEGDTLEKIIDGLREGDAAYTHRFSIDTRVGIFLQILRTMAFAHVADRPK